LHWVTLASISQYSTDEVDRMLDEGRRWRCSVGSLERLLRTFGEVFLWRILGRGACSRLDLRLWVWHWAWRDYFLVGRFWTWGGSAFLGEDWLFSFCHQDGACSLWSG